MTELTPEQIEEITKCKDDPVYFIDNYVKYTCLHPVTKLYDYQEVVIRHYHKNRFSICKASRQSGKSFVVNAYLLHYIIFNEKVTAGLFTMNRNNARELLNRIKTMYLEIPEWLRHGATISNNMGLVLENNSIIVCLPVNFQDAKGIFYDMIVLDEFAFVDDDVAVNFWNAMAPTIYSNPNGKIIISSTPARSHRLKEIINEEKNPENIVVSTPFYKVVPTFFYKLWADALFGYNEFCPISVVWNQMPGKDEEWREKMIQNIGIDSFKNEFECEFLYLQGEPK